MSKAWPPSRVEDNIAAVVLVAVVVYPENEGLAVAVDESGMGDGERGGWLDGASSV